MIITFSCRCFSFKLRSFEVNEMMCHWLGFFFCYCFIRTTLLIAMKYAWNVCKCKFLHHQYHQTPQVYTVLLRWYLHKYSENVHRNKMWKQKVKFFVTKKRIENSYGTNVLLMNENPKREYKMNESWSFLRGTWCKES